MGVDTENFNRIRLQHKLTFISRDYDSFLSWNYAGIPSRCLFYHGFQANWLAYDKLKDSLKGDQQGSYFICEDYECFSNVVRTIGHIGKVFYYSESHEPLAINDFLHSNVSAPLNLHNFYHDISGTQFNCVDEFIYESIHLGEFDSGIDESNTITYIPEDSVNAKDIQRIASSRRIILGKFKNDMLKRCLEATALSFGLEVINEGVELNCIKHYNPFEISSHKSLLDMLSR